MTHEADHSRIDVTAVGGRSGWAQSADGRLRVDLGANQVRSLAATGISPEYLWGAAIAVAFLDAIFQAARERGATVTHDSTVTARIALEPVPDHAAPRMAVTLRADLPDLSEDEAMALMLRASELSPYTQALRGKATLGFVLE